MTRRPPERPAATFPEVAGMAALVVVMVSDEYDYLWWLPLTCLMWDHVIGGLFAFGEWVAERRRFRRRTEELRLRAMGRAMLDKPPTYGPYEP